MIAKIGWKNIWRKKGRSFLVIASVAIGVWAGLFFSAFQWGSIEQKMNDLVNREIGHVQIHHKSFIDEEYDYNFPIENHQAVKAFLEQDTSIEKFTERIVFSGMISTGKKSLPILIYGVDTALEGRIYPLKKMLQEGGFVKGKRSPTVMVSTTMMKDLGLDLDKKVNISGGMLHQPISFVGRARATYDSPNKLKDKLVAYIHREDLVDKLKKDYVHEYAVIFKNEKLLEENKERLASQFPQHEVKTWGEIMPSIQEALEMTDAVMSIFMMIIWIALALGIINTMLMSILERTQELGVLMAIGMGRWSIVKLIFFETSILTVIGVPLGLALNFITLYFLEDSGIDLSFMSKAMEDFGYETIIYPAMKTSFYSQVVLQVVFVALISTVFPAWRALKLIPIEAIRKN